MERETKARFVEPMLLLPSQRFPAGSNWMYELKLDGYRAIAVKSNANAHLRSRNNKNFDDHYPQIVTALAPMPDETVIDGEVVALDDSGRPSFNLLQNYGSAEAPLLYYVFGVMIRTDVTLRARSSLSGAICCTERCSHTCVIRFANRRGSKQVCRT